MHPVSKKSPGDDQTKPPKDDLMAKVAAAAAHDGEIAALQAKIAELEAQMQTFKEAAARAQAELQNAKVRMEREASEIRKYASQATLMRLLSTIDNFQRAFKHLPADIASHEWVKGMAATEQEFVRQLKDLGLAKMEALGQLVDPHAHEVLMEGPGEKGKVIEVLEDGYELHGKVLRVAKVKVGAGS